MTEDQNTKVKEEGDVSTRWHSQIEVIVLYCIASGVECGGGRPKPSFLLHRV